MIGLLRNTHHRRILVLAFAGLVGFGLVSLRLVHLTLAQAARFRERAAGQHVMRVTLTPQRGDIRDRNGRSLAVSVLRETLTVRREAIGDNLRRRIAAACVEIFGGDRDRYLARLTGRGYVPLVRRMEPEQADRVREFIEGLDRTARGLVYLEPETKRLYPNDTLAAAVIGFTEPDETGENAGRTGIEAAWNSHLRGRRASDEVFRNNAQQAMEPVAPEALIASAGHVVQLTIDGAIQSIAEESLADMVLANRAEWGAAVVIDPRNGEVLAMASYPTHNLNSHADYPEANKHNYATWYPVDPGSLMKVFTFAAALEEQVTTEDEVIDLHGGVWYNPIHPHLVQDDRGHRMASADVRQGFAVSSNVMTVMLAERVGAARLARHFAAFGIGQRTGIDLPGERSGTLRPGERWRGADHSTICRGQGVTMTALQAAAGLAAIANRGVWLRPQIVLRIEDATGQEISFERNPARRRVISSLTAQRMLSLLEEAVLEGTGDLAAIPGYRVGGKTGTADRWDEQAGGYDGSYNATFGGVAPIDDPRVVCVVMVGNLRRGRGVNFYGGDVAAPVFRTIVENSLRILGVPPNQTEIAQSPSEVVISEASAAQPAPGGASALANLPPDRMGPVMPDLAGLTMREVTSRLATFNVSLCFQGTGCAVSQAPMPGAPMQGVPRVFVFFEDPQAHGG